jgi:hypothetical protein
MRTADRLTRLEDAVWQLVIVACDGQDPRHFPDDEDPNRRAMNARLSGFLDAIGSERAVG